MMRWLADLWHRDDGAATGLEWALVASVLVLGTVLALAVVRRTLLGE
jgi:hypothetical protein